METVISNAKSRRRALLGWELVWLAPLALGMALFSIPGAVVRYLMTPALVRHLKAGNEPDVEATRRLIERTPNVAALVGYSEESGEWLLPTTEKSS